VGQKIANRRGAGKELTPELGKEKWVKSWVTINWKKPQHAKLLEIRVVQTPRSMIDRELTKKRRPKRRSKLREGGPNWTLAKGLNGSNK